MMYLHLDAHEGDRVFWFTTTGWMMWNFLVSVLLTDAAIVLYDGNPGTPDMGRLWDLAEESGMTCFGTSASYIAACMKAGVEPAAGRDLSALRAIGSTGSPLAPEGFAWVYEHVGADTWLFSTSGGTDVCTAFVGGCPLLPVYEGELQARALGADLHAFDEHGRPVIGEVGELVLTQPMPSMPLRFWGDDDGSRLHEAYFASTPASGATATGSGSPSAAPRSSTAARTRPSTAAACGWGRARSTARCWRCDDIVDALVVDVPREGDDSWMPLFVVLREGGELDDALVAEIRARVREDCSPRHVPSEILEIAEVPRTLSGKVLEVPVKRILMGEEAARAASRDSLANPAALDCSSRWRARREPESPSARASGSTASGGRHDRGHAARTAAARRQPRSRSGRPPLGWRVRTGAGPHVQQRGTAPVEPLAAQVDPHRVRRAEHAGRPRRPAAARAPARRERRARHPPPRPLPAVAGRGGQRVERDRRGDEQHDRRDELRRAEQRPVGARRRAPPPRRTASAATPSHHSPPGTPAKRRAQPPRATSVRATSRSTAPPASAPPDPRRALRVRGVLTRSAAPTSTTCVARRRNTQRSGPARPAASISSDSAPTAAITSPATGAPSATSPPAAASAQATATPPARCGRSQSVSTHASCPRARRSSCAQIAYRRSASLHTRRGADIEPNATHPRGR